MKTVGAMLAGDIGAIAFELPEPPDGELVRCAVSDRGTTENLDARFLSLGGGRALMTVKLRGADGAVSVRTATRSYELGALGGIIGELQPFVAELAALDEVARIELAGFLAGTQSGHGELKLARALSDRLVEIHAAVRTKRSGARIERGGQIGLQVEALIAADRTTFYARGWLASRDGAPVRLTAVSPEGARVELIDRLYRYPRTDVAELYGDEPAEELVTPSGFAASFEIPAPSLREGGWTFELEDSAGLCVETSEEEFVHVSTVRMRLLGELGFEPPYGRELVSRHLHPVLHKLQARHAADVSVADVREYGTRPEDPDVSVVVPLYRRTDFIQHQLAQFALDGEFERVDLVYVLDSPELAHDLDFTAQQLHDLYRIPFSVVVYQVNASSGLDIPFDQEFEYVIRKCAPTRPAWL